MLEFLYRLIIGHHHKWEINQTVKVLEKDEPNPSKLIVVLQCSVCGKLKNHHIVS
jgi:hypothetical protein